MLKLILPCSIPGEIFLHDGSLRLLPDVIIAGNKACGFHEPETTETTIEPYAFFLQRRDEEAHRFGFSVTK